VRETLLATVAVILTASSAWAFDAVVTRCHDGDTCTVVPSGEHPIMIRLHAIDAPELDQPFGVEARDVMARLVVGRHVDVRPISGFSHGRMVADLIVKDGPDAGGDAGATMVRMGAAWVEDRWNLNPDAPELQAKAQHAYRGLWADPDAIAPRIWRHEHPQAWQGHPLQR
jgi:micrococcal nuclease